MAALSANDLVAQLRTFRLLPEEQLAILSSDLLQRFPDPKELMRELLQRGWLTPHQANRLLQGRGCELAPSAPPQALVAAPPTILDSGVRWRLGLIIGGVFLMIALIAFLARPKANRKDGPPNPDQKERTTHRGDAWPDNLERLPGNTKSIHKGEDFTGKHTSDGVSIEVQGHFASEDIAVDSISVRREGQITRTYDDLESLPVSQQKIAETLLELGRRRIFGEWTE
jgi:hypothetical protein